MFHDADQSAWARLRPPPQRGADQPRARGDARVRQDRDGRFFPAELRAHDTRECPGEDSGPHSSSDPRHRSRAELFAVDHRGSKLDAADAGPVEVVLAHAEEGLAELVDVSMRNGSVSARLLSLVVMR